MWIESIRKQSRPPSEFGTAEGDLIGVCQTGMELTRDRYNRAFARKPFESVMGKATRYIAYIFSGIFLTFYFTIGVSNIIYYLVIASISLKLILDNKGDSLSLTLNVCIIYLFLVPNITLLLIGSSEYIFLLVFSFILFDVIFIFSNIKTDSKRNYREIISIKTQKRYNKICLSMIFLSIIVPFVISGNDFIRTTRFNIPFGISLIFFDRICSYERIYKIILFLFFYFISVASFVLFHWGGFGRITVGAYIMMPILLASYRRGIPIRTWQAAVLAPPALLLAIISRYGEGELTSLHSGSSAHHMILTKQMIDAISVFSTARWGDYFDQWLLFFLNWFPRNVWPDKPIGIGLYFVDEWLGRRGYSEGHSISLGYMGEAFYLLGPWGLIGVGVGLVTIILTRRVLSAISSPYIAPVIVYDVMLISYVWGGYATFGSRAWFFIIPMLGWIFFFTPRPKRRQNFI